MQAESQVEKFARRMDEMRAQGLSDYKFATGNVAEATPESFAKEANDMLDAIEAGEFQPFKFNDAPELRA